MRSEGKGSDDDDEEKEEKEKKTTIRQVNANQEKNGVINK
jgi:hypothetical protein